MDHQYSDLDLRLDLDNLDWDSRLRLSLDFKSPTVVFLILFKDTLDQLLKKKVQKNKKRSCLLG